MEGEVSQRTYIPCRLFSESKCDLPDTYSTLQSQYVNPAPACESRTDTWVSQAGLSVSHAAGAQAQSFTPPNPPTPYQRAYHCFSLPVFYPTIILRCPSTYVLSYTTFGGDNSRFDINLFYYLGL